MCRENLIQTFQYIYETTLHLAGIALRLYVITFMFSKDLTKQCFDDDFRTEITFAPFSKRKQLKQQQHWKWNCESRSVNG